jgi:hypothetical protein
VRGTGFAISFLASPLSSRSRTRCSGLRRPGRVCRAGIGINTAPANTNM